MGVPIFHNIFLIEVMTLCLYAGMFCIICILLYTVLSVNIFINCINNKGFY